MFKLLMVNFLFPCADGTWLIECVDTSDLRSIMDEDSEGQTFALGAR
jgi:hypothetical protein